MSRRITITVEDGVSDAEAVELVAFVVARPRRDNGSYRSFYVQPIGVSCQSSVTRTGNDTFRVWREEPQ